MKTIYYFAASLLIILLSLTSALGEVFFYHTDNFGTPMAMTDMSGEVVWRADELPFGEEYETVENPIKNDRRFLGKELDESTGLICMGSRYLDPDTGRFTQPDPVRLVDPATGKINQEMLLNPQRQNRYVYGLNNPYKYVDPDGEFAFIGALALGAFALDMMMPQSTDVSNSKGALDHMGSAASLVAPVGAGIKITRTALQLPSVVKSAKGVIGAFRRKGYSYRIDTNKVAPGEGGFHLHVYKGKDEIAKINGKGGWVKTHNGKQL